MFKRCNVRRSLLATPFAAMSLVSLDAVAQPTIDTIRDRGYLRCGVSEGLRGFSEKLAFRSWRGFDVDFCRAVATAVFNDAREIEFVPLSASKRFGALTEGKIDVLSRNTTWTMLREIDLDVDFVGISYIDVQGFMVHKSSGIMKAADLNNKAICVLKGTTLQDNLQKFLDKNRIHANILYVGSRSKLRRTYQAQICSAYAADVSALVAEKTELSEPDAHIFLPDYVAKEPLGPVVANTDPKWRELVQLVLYLLINAEEEEWTSTQAETANLSARIIVPKSISQKLGLATDWERTVISAVGNYGEIFDRNLGSGSPLGISRGFNKLWSNGGALIAPPIQ